MSGQRAARAAAMYGASRQKPVPARVCTCSTALRYCASSAAKRPAPFSATSGESSPCVATYSTGQRRNSPWLRYASTTVAMPPRVPGAAPSMMSTGKGFMGSGLQPPDADPFPAERRGIEHALHVDEAAVPDDLLHQHRGRQLCQALVRHREDGGSGLR